jgi:uncharacterized protein YxeA
MKKVMAIMFGLLMVVGMANAAVLRISRTTNISGYLLTTSGSYATARDSASASNATFNEYAVSVYTEGNPYSHYRSIFRFDTSSLGSSSVIDSVKFKVTKFADMSTEDHFLKLVAALPTLSTSSFLKTVTNDFVGWTAGPGTPAYAVTLLADSITTVALPDTVIFTFITAGKAIINKTGTTQFFMLSNKDIDYVAPSI